MSDHHVDPESEEQAEAFREYSRGLIGDARAKEEAAFVDMLRHNTTQVTENIGADTWHLAAQELWLFDPEQRDAQDKVHALVRYVTKGALRQSSGQRCKVTVTFTFTAEVTE